MSEKDKKVCKVCKGTGLDPAYNDCSDPDCCYQDESCWECGGDGKYNGETEYE